MSLIHKLLLLLFVQLIAIQISGQVKRDSIYYKGKYYNKADYERAKSDYEKFNFDERFMPGAGYGFYVPAKSDSIGIFSGVVVKYLLFRDVSQNDDPGPSHVDFYAKLGLFNSNEDAINQVFLYSAGLDLSFEKDPHRYFFIPYFGLEIGGLSQKSYGTTIQFTPTFGVHLFSKPNISIDLNAGYVYPIKNFEHLSGWYGDICLNFVLW